MTEQELCNTIYALGRLGVKWSSLSVDVRRQLLLSVESTAIHMVPAGLVMVLLGLGRMQYMWEDMSSTLISALNRSIERLLQAPSGRTLSSLVHALATVGE